MRRILMLALLVGAAALIRPLGSAALGSETLVAFGILILGAYAAGELLAGMGLPKLVGYIAAGVVFGPGVLATVDADSVSALSPVSSLAIALIAFLAGAELRWSEVKRLGGAFAKILASELTLSFVAITGFLLVVRARIPFLSHGTSTEVFAFALLFSSVAIVHSPAVTMALLSETKAQGPLSRVGLGVVLLSDPVIVLLLTGALALARALVPPGAENAAALSVGAVAWHVLGAVLVGAVLGGLVALYLRFVRRELFLFAIIVAFFGVELARITNVETLLLLITAGFVTENVSQMEHAADLREAMARAAAPVFVVFFALAGAHISLSRLAATWLLVLPLALVRGGAIWAGCRVGTRWARITGPEHVQVRAGLWTALIPQAGVAIGLAAVVAQAYPVRGGEIRDLFLALLTVNQMVGAVVFKRALAKSGETAVPIPPLRLSMRMEAVLIPEQGQSIESRES